MAGGTKWLGIPLRWVVITVFLFSSTLNYLDRQLLAAVAPMVKSEFHLTNQDYGLILLALSISYALSAPLAGLFIDRVGLRLGISVAVAGWSLAGAATAFVGSFAGLLGARVCLGVAESASLPAAGKANGAYLPPHEFALGSAMNQIGLSLGGISAPLVVGALAVSHGWRSVFLICGLLGLAWIPVWLFVAGKAPAGPSVQSQRTVTAREMFADRRFLGLIAANVVSATMYTLWSNWVTLYFVEVWGMTQAQANRGYAWIPPVVATLGGLFGGALAYRLIRGGMPVASARIRVCFIAALGMLVTAAIPFMPSPGIAVSAISYSYFWSTCLAITVYVMPIDFFGPGRAAFAVSFLTFSYGLMQAVVSPLIGATVDRFGFAPVLFGIAGLPLLATGILKATARHADQ